MPQLGSNNDHMLPVTGPPARTGFIAQMAAAVPSAVVQWDRIFYGNLPAPGGYSAVIAANARGQNSVISVKVGGDYDGVIAGSYDSQFNAVFASMQTAGVDDCIMALQHEPENDGGIVASKWVAAQHHVADLLHAHTISTLHGWRWATILMLGTFAGQAGRNPEDWWCGAGSVGATSTNQPDIYLVDNYDKAGADDGGFDYATSDPSLVSVQSWIGCTADYYYSSLHLNGTATGHPRVPWGLGEIGVCRQPDTTDVNHPVADPTGAKRTAALNKVLVDGRILTAELACWFDMGPSTFGGVDAGKADYHIRDESPSLVAFAAMDPAPTGPAPNVLTTISSETDAAAFSSGPATPDTDQLLVAWVGAERTGDVNPITPTVANSPWGLSWARDARADNIWTSTGTGTPRRAGWIFVAETGSSALGPDTFDLDFGGVTHMGCEAIVVQVPGADLGVKLFPNATPMGVYTSGSTMPITTTEENTLGVHQLPTFFFGRLDSAPPIAYNDGRILIAQIAPKSGGITRSWHDIAAGVWDSGIITFLDAVALLTNDDVYLSFSDESDGGAAQTADAAAVNGTGTHTDFEAAYNRIMGLANTHCPNAHHYQSYASSTHFGTWPKCSAANVIGVDPHVYFGNTTATFSGFLSATQSALNSAGYGSIPWVINTGVAEEAIGGQAKADWFTAMFAAMANAKVTFPRLLFGTYWNTDSGNINGHPATETINSEATGGNAAALAAFQAGLLTLGVPGLAALIQSVKNAGGTASTYATTLAAAANSASIELAFYAHNTNVSGIDPDTANGWTELTEVNHANPTITGAAHLETGAFDLTPQATSATGQLFGAWGIEIKGAAYAPQAYAQSVSGAVQPTGVVKGRPTKALKGQISSGTPSKSFSNDAEGQTNNAAVTLANSAASGDALSVFTGGSGAMTYDNTVLFSGSTMSFKASTGAGSGSTDFAQAFFTGLVAPQIYARAQFNWTSMPPGAVPWQFLSVSGVQIRAGLGVNSAGKLVLLDGTTTIATSTLTLSINTWYRFELTYNATTGASTGKVYDANGILLGTVSGTVSTDGNTSLSVLFGLLNDCATTVWFDQPLADGSGSAITSASGAPASLISGAGFTGTYTDINEALAFLLGGATGITRAQHAIDKNNTPATGAAPSWGTPTTAGSLLVLVVAVNHIGAGAPAIVVPSGWVFRQQLDDGSAAGCIAYYSIINAPSRSGPELCTASGAGSSSIAAWIAEYPGIDSTQPSGSSDRVIGVTGSSASLTTGTTVSPTIGSSELAIGAFATYGAAVTYSGAGQGGSAAGGTLATSPTVPLDTAVTTNGTSNQRTALAVWDYFTGGNGTYEFHATASASKSFGAFALVFRGPSQMVQNSTGTAAFRVGFALTPGAINAVAINAKMLKGVGSAGTVTYIARVYDGSTLLGSTPASPDLPTTATNFIEIFSGINLDAANLRVEIEFTASGSYRGMVSQLWVDVLYATGGAGVGQMSGSLALFKATLKTATPSGILSSIGNMVPRANKALVSKQKQTATLSSSRSQNSSLTALLAATAVLVKFTSRSTSGQLVTTGSLSRRISRILTALLTSAGAVIKSQALSLSGILAPAATLGQSLSKNMVGVLSFIGTPKKRTSRALTALLSSIGSLSDALPKTLSGLLQSSGTIRSLRNPSLVANLFQIGTLTKRTSRSLGGSFQPTGSPRRGIFHALTASLASSGAIAVGSAALTKAIAGVLSFSGAFQKIYGKTFSGFLGAGGTGASVALQDFDSDATNGANYTLDTNPGLPANLRMIAKVMATGVTASIPTFRGHGVTWVLRGSTTDAQGNTLFVFDGDTGPNGTTAGVAGSGVGFSCDNASGCVWMIEAVSGYNLNQKGPVQLVFAKGASSTKPSVTLPNPVTGRNILVGSATASGRQPTAWTPPAGFITDKDTGYTPPTTSMQSVYNLAPGSVTTFAWTGTGGNFPWDAVLYEVPVEGLAGALKARAIKALTATLVSSGGLPPGRLLTQAISGLLTSTATVARSVKHFFTLGGLFGPTSTLVRRSTASVAGSLSPQGSTGTRLARSLAGALTSSGSLSRRIGRSLTGALSFTGAIADRSQRFLSGLLRSAGAMTAVKATAGSLGGSLSPTGALSRRSSKTFSGVLASSATLSLPRSFVRSFSGTLSASADLLARAGRTLAGLLVSSGTMKPLQFRSLSGSLGSAGSLIKGFATSLVAVLRFVHTPVAHSQVLSGQLRMTGDLQRGLGTIHAVSSGEPQGLAIGAEETQLDIGSKEVP